MIINPWKTNEAQIILQDVRQGAVEGAKMKSLCQSTCEDLAQDVIHQLVQRPYTVLRYPYSYGRKAGYFRACSFLRKKCSEEQYLEEEKRLVDSVTSGDLLAQAVKQEQLQSVDMFLHALPLEDMVLVYGTAALGESVGYVASLLNRARGTRLTTEAYRARLKKLKKRATQTLDVAV